MKDDVFNKSFASLNNQIAFLVKIKCKIVNVCIHCSDKLCRPQKQIA